MAPKEGGRTHPRTVLPWKVLRSKTMAWLTKGTILSKASSVDTALIAPPRLSTAQLPVKLLVVTFAVDTVCHGRRTTGVIAVYRQTSRHSPTDRQMDRPTDIQTATATTRRLQIDAGSSAGAPLVTT
jgi:hypothetical protein